jgi:hypothetical protein
MKLEYKIAYAVSRKKVKQPKTFMQTTYPLRVQAIRSKGQQPRLYISFPGALAAAIGLEPGELVQWELLDRGELHLVRQSTPAPTTQRKASKK